MCSDIAIIEHDGRTPGLPNAPLVMKQDNNNTDREIAF